LIAHDIPFQKIFIFKNLQFKNSKFKFLGTLIAPILFLADHWKSGKPFSCQMLGASHIAWGGYV